MVVSAIQAKILFWGSVVIALALAGMVTYHFVLVGALEKQLGTCQTSVGTLTTSLATVRSNRDLLKVELENQTKKVREFIEESKAASEAAMAAWKAEQKKTAAWREKYEELINAPQQGEACTAIELRLDRYIKMRIEEPK